MNRLEVWAPAGLPEVTEGADLGLLIANATELRNGDIVVITSKVVSKSEGRVSSSDRDWAVAQETVRVVARRGTTQIVVNRLGLTMAAAGVDASNVEAGCVVFLPADPDESARSIRTRLRELTGANTAVVITDTAGRAWRVGQTDIAIGAAGLIVAENYAGSKDAHGNDLVVTMPAAGDEIAAAADLVKGKVNARPVAIVRGRSDLVLACEDDGPGAASLVRSEGEDLFAYGAREAVVRALAGHLEDRAPFGPPATVEELLDALHRLPTTHQRVEESVESFDGRARSQLTLPADTARAAAEAVATAYGWVVENWDQDECSVRVRLREWSPVLEVD